MFPSLSSKRAVNSKNPDFCLQPDCWRWGCRVFTFLFHVVKARLKESYFRQKYSEHYENRILRRVPGPQALRNIYFAAKSFFFGSLQSQKHHKKIYVCWHWCSKYENVALLQMYNWAPLRKELMSELTNKDANEDNKKVSVTPSLKQHLWWFEMTLTTRSAHSGIALSQSWIYASQCFFSTFKQSLKGPEWWWPARWLWEQTLVCSTAPLSGLLLCSAAAREGGRRASCEPSFLFNAEPHVTSKNEISTSKGHGSSSSSSSSSSSPTQRWSPVSPAC